MTLKVRVKNEKIKFSRTSVILGGRRFVLGVFMNTEEFFDIQV